MAAASRQRAVEFPIADEILRRYGGRLPPNPIIEQHGQHERILICGPRTFDRPLFVFLLVAGLKRRYGPEIVIIHGCARGVDSMADEAAEYLGLEVDPYPVDWSRGSFAANVRNREMYRDGKPDLCVAMGYGSGTADMVSVCRAGGTRVIWREPTYVPEEPEEILWHVA